MPRPLPSQQLQAVERAAARFPGGASLSDVFGAMHPPPARRSLQRWLALLVADGKLIQDGEGRMARYRRPLTRGTPTPSHASAVVAATPTELVVSADAGQVRLLVRRPLVQRKPVGYDPEFLKAYRPNRTFYLPPAMRRHLAEIGVSWKQGQPAGTHARDILDRLLIDLSWNSSRLEGNTYSLLETERLLQLGAVAEGKDAGEAQMILNHKRAIELLVQDAGEIGFNRYTLLNLHAALAENLLANPNAAGRLREIAVGIDRSVFHPIEGPQRIVEMFDLLLKKAQAIKNPFEQAFFSMVHLPYLQPFEDVNKRVSRLAANIPFIRMNLSPLSFVDVPQRDYVDGLLGVYELNRIELLREVFLWAYERSCARYAAIRQTVGEPDVFRQQYRALLSEVVSDVVRQVLNKQEAAQQVRQAAMKLSPREDQRRFAEMAESELAGLHEGNFARFRIRPSEFKSWRAQWK
jgi:Fic family protein